MSTANLVALLAKHGIPNVKVFSVDSQGAFLAIVDQEFKWVDGKRVWQDVSYTIPATYQAVMEFLGY